jgi:hypothetical protein
VGDETGLLVRNVVRSEAFIGLNDSAKAIFAVTTI